MRGRPPRVRLDDILDAAVELGVDRLSMRGLARHLGVGASTLYYHVASKEDLLTQLGARLLDRFRPELGAPDNWPEALRRAGLGLRALFERTPGLAHSAMLDPHWGDAVVALHEEACAHLVRAGFSPGEAWLAVRALADFVEDFVVRREAHRNAGTTHLAHAAQRGGPTLRAAHRALGDDPGEARFEAGLDTLVRGLVARRNARVSMKNG